MASIALMLIGPLAHAEEAWVGEGTAAGSCTRPTIRNLSFCGYEWTVKASVRPVGPGPNYFSDSPASARVDAEGRLHLRIRRDGDRYACSEVISKRSFGYGTYRFTVEGADGMDARAVLGMFTWCDRDPAYHHREIDCEVSRWGDPQRRNSQFVVQPYEQKGNIERFEVPAGTGPVTFSFTWKPNEVTFCCAKGPADSAGVTDVLRAWTCTTEAVPKPGGEQARINLWLFRGQAPSNNEEVEVIVRRFEFRPL